MVAEHTVSLQIAAPRTIAAVCARLAANRVPAEFGRYLDQVYAARASGLQLDGQNVFVYRDAVDQPGSVDVEFGVGIKATFAPVGIVQPVALPVGEVATTTHIGPYNELGAAHKAIVVWCRANARTPAGPRWEVYGHWSPTELSRTDVYYLLNPV